ncbi:hypothetical protein J5Y09_19970 [Roseomonas sp. PWR1]|uniref:AlpA family phage regulatory protein n=1 Tax=Roseomonas nitratireducens TaxID=2820810 RepID=A0ABS4AY77_9PROT|nr:hypothetical protein [Neoroseomonas nitratireducens]MBP0466214.1 hypothetical protein [Neoroseomonas nitratireducens]
MPSDLSEPRRRKPLPPAPSFAADAALLTAAEGAAVARIGVSTFWLRVKEGRFPPPIYIGAKSPRWRLSELRAALGVAA